MSSSKRKQKFLKKRTSRSVKKETNMVYVPYVPLETVVIGVATGYFIAHLLSEKKIEQ